MEKGNIGNVNFVLIDRTLDDPVFMQYHPISFKIDCKRNEYKLSLRLEKDERKIAAVLVDYICDFCEAEILALYQERGVKTDDLEAIETFAHPVSEKNYAEVDNYLFENTSETPLPLKEFKNRINEEQVIYSDKSRNKYEIKKDIPLSLILKSNPKYCGWKVGWVYFGTDELMDKKSSRYVRINEFYFKNGIADIWTLNFYDNKNYVLMREKINCIKRKIKIEDFQVKKGEDLAVTNVPPEFKKWNSPAPNSPQMFLLQNLCSSDVIKRNDFLGKIIDDESTWVRLLKEKKIRLKFIPKILFE